MTLCIAALCLEEDQKGEDHKRVVISFDRRMETNIAGGDVAFKFDSISHYWAGLIAGEVGLAWEALAKFKRHLQDDTVQITEDSVLDELRKPLSDLRTEFADRYVRKTLGIPFADLLAGKHSIPEDVVSRTWYEIPYQAPSEDKLQLILIGWIGNRFHLFKVAGTEVDRHDPFVAIGSGADIAEPALFQREHRATWPLGKTLYVVREAHTLGCIAPGVSKNAELTVIYYNEERDSLNWRVSYKSTIGRMDKLYGRYGFKKLPKDIPVVPDDFLDYAEPEETNTENA